MKPAIRFSGILFITVFLVMACHWEEERPGRSDFSVLAKHAGDYQQAKPGKALIFPDDHGPHPGYRIEWWYLTANLADTEGRPYGVQWTLFRFAVNPRGTGDAVTDWHTDQVFMAHMAITTPDDHVSFQRYARGTVSPALARAGVEASPFAAWMDDWILQSKGVDWLPMEVRARQDGYSLRLDLTSNKPPVLQGEAGFSQKHPDGGGSFYYSQPFLEAAGELTVNGQKILVSGQAWLDREWGSQFLGADQSGWDWFSLHLENGEKIVLFQLRQKPGESPSENFLYGNLITADGHTRPLDAERLRLTVQKESVVMGHKLPMLWQIDVPQIDRRFTVEALHPNQWMDVDFPYWEGVIIVDGDGPQNRGRGYMELTGYPFIGDSHD